MIRVLAIIAITGFLLAVVCVGGSVAIASHAIAQGGAGSKWGSSSWWNHIEPSVDITPSTAQATRQVAWTGDDHLTVSLPAEVTYTQGSDSGVTISGPSDLIERIDVSGGDISLRGVRYRNVAGVQPIRISIRAPAVTRFELDGADKFTIQGYNQDELRIQANGSADMDAHGKAQSLHLELNGASRADLGDVVLTDAHIQANGASSVTAAPTGDADVEINGVGQVTLVGQPKSLNQQIHGLGSVNIRPAEKTAPAPAADTKTKTPKGDERRKTS